MIRYLQYYILDNLVNRKADRINIVIGINNILSMTCLHIDFFSLEDKKNNTLKKLTE